MLITNYTGQKMLGIMNLNQTFLVKFDMTMIFFYFYINEDSLSQIWHFYLKQQLSWAVLSMTTHKNEVFQNLCLLF